VTHKEAFFVVVGVDAPAGDAVGVVAAHLAGVGVEHVHAVDLDLRLVDWRVQHAGARDNALLCKRVGRGILPAMRT